MSLYKRIVTLMIISMPLFSCKSTPPHTHILWPAKQAKPMLEYIGSYVSTEDFERSSWETFIATIISEPEEFFFNLPFGVSGNAAGTIYVTDQKGIKLLDVRSNKFKQILDRKDVKQPSGIAVDDNGRLLVVDGKEKKLVILSPEGAILKSIGDEKTFGKPSFIAMNKNNGNLYVSDMTRHRIATFDRSGNFLFFIGKPGKEPGEFAFPQGIAVSPDNQLYVADMLNARIQIFTADGKFIRSFGYQGTDYREFEAPRALAFGPDGNLYVVDYKKALLYTFSPDGRMLLVTGDLKKSSHPLSFTSPTSIYIDDKGVIYITDLMMNRISVWQILTPEYLQVHPLEESIVR